MVRLFSYFLFWTSWKMTKEQLEICSNICVEVTHEQRVCCVSCRTVITTTTSVKGMPSDQPVKSKPVNDSQKPNDNIRRDSPCSDEKPITMNELKNMSNEEKEGIRMLTLCGSVNCNDLTVSELPKLELLRITDKSFPRCRGLKIEKCASLKKIVVGNKCLIGGNEKEGVVDIDCPYLTELEIGRESLPHVNVFKANSPTLTIKCGSLSLPCEEFELESTVS